MSRQALAITALLLAATFVFFAIPSVSKPLKQAEKASSDDAKPQYASIVERKLEFYDFSYQTVDGATFDLREYAKDKGVVLVEYFAGWCPNSNRNGHIVERLWNEYRNRGLGVVAVAEYSDFNDLRIHINRIGIDYPVVVETRRRDQRKASLHYKYRHAVDDKRKWGTPFYVIIDTRDIEAPGSTAPLARRVYTVSGEIMESEADQFIRDRLASFQKRD